MLHNLLSVLLLALDSRATVKAATSPPHESSGGWRKDTVSDLLRLGSVLWVSIRQSLHILYTGRPYQVLALGWQVPLNSHGQDHHHHHKFTTVLRPFIRDHPGEPAPEENFWTLWCKERLTEADTVTIQLGATPSGLSIVSDIAIFVLKRDVKLQLTNSGLSSAHLHHPPFFTGWMPFMPPNQQCQSTEGNYRIQIREKTLEFSSTVLPA